MDTGPGVSGTKPADPDLTFGRLPQVYSQVYL